MKPSRFTLVYTHGFGVAAALLLSLGPALATPRTLYVTNLNSNTIMAFTPSGVGTLFASTGLNGPVGLAFGPATSAPEPASMTLFGVAMAGLAIGGNRRFRRKR